MTNDNKYPKADVLVATLDDHERYFQLVTTLRVLEVTFGAARRNVDQQRMTKCAQYAEDNLGIASKNVSHI